MSTVNINLQAKDLTASGGQGVVDPTPNTLVQRTSTGAIKATDATTDNEAVNKGQMDTALDDKVDKTNETEKIYGTNYQGMQYLYPLKTLSPAAYSVPLRTVNGALVAANPTQNNELTTKEYVDNLVQQGSGGSTENGVFTNSVTIGDPNADSSGGTNTVITDTSIDMWSRAGGEELKITLGNDPDVYYRNNGQSKFGSAKFENIVNVANAYAGASFYLTPFTVDNLKVGTVEVQDELILKSPNGTKYKITVGDDGALATTIIT